MNGWIVVLFLVFDDVFFFFFLAFESKYRIVLACIVSKKGGYATEKIMDVREDDCFYNTALNKCKFILPSAWKSVIVDKHRRRSIYCGCVYKSSKALV